LLMMRRSQIISIALSLIAICSALYLVSNRGHPIETEKRAAIIDGLSEEFPNPELIHSTSDVLRAKGYRVDIYNASAVTVGLYGELPSMGYNLMIIRVHCAPMDGGNRPGAALFTSEEEPGLYMTEQLLGWVRMARTLTRGDRYYSVTPAFLREGMKGEFDHTVIILMSCYGCIDDTLAETFIGKGASTFVGWTGRVTPEHMDGATSVLLERMLIEGVRSQRPLNIQ